MHVPEIINVKEKLEDLKSRGLIKEWELPYENILTRLNAAIFFITPADTIAEDQLKEKLSEIEEIQEFRLNEEQKLSKLKYRVMFGKPFEA